MTDHKIPGREEWAGYKSDLDVKNAHQLFFGKSIAEVQQYFEGGQSIQRASELLFVPRPAFQYYVFALAEYLVSEKAIGDSDSASPFLRLLIAREKRDPGSVAQIYTRLAPTVEYVASHQEKYDADVGIYGDFQDHAAELKALCEAPHNRRA
jgi:hypothetical protein